MLDITKDILLPLTIGVISYLLFAKFDQWKIRKKQSRLGEAVIDSLIEEVRNGIAILENFATKDELTSHYLPSKSWNGMQTINDDVLLRIIEVTKDKVPDHFPPREIRIHCKNYFDIMADQWNHNVALIGKQSHNQTITFASDLINERRYLEAAKGVLKMLLQTKILLKENADKLMPR